VIQIKGQFAPDTCKAWEIDTRAGGHFYTSATMAALQKMLEIADVVGSEMGKLKGSIQLSSSWIFADRVTSKFSSTIHTRVKELNDPVVWDAWHNMLDREHLTDAIYMTALKAVLENNKIVAIYNDRNNLYRHEMNF